MTIENFNKKCRSWDKMYKLKEDVQLKLFFKKKKRKKKMNKNQR